MSDTLESTQFESPYFAAIDLGSNSFHLLVARVKENGSGIETVDREKQMVQIARGLNDDGFLTEEAQERALICLHQFAERIRDIPISQIRAVGTKTLRAAHNSSLFLKSAERVLGVKIQTISGYEEARLVYAGLSNTITKSNQRLVIDIGGGSTEFIIGSGHTPIQLESLSMGCVAFSEQYKLYGKEINRITMRNAYYAACAELEEIRKNYLKTGWEIAYGTSGTMKAVGEILSQEDGGAIITKDSVNALAETIIEEGAIHSDSIPPLRQDVLPAGIAIIQAIFDQLKLETIHVADATLKEGLIFDTIGRFGDRDIRQETVESLVTRYNVDLDQGNRVKDIALALWRQIDPPALPGVSRSKILRWASMLHEIGLAISHSGYHHHGHYLIRYSDLAGFGRYEQYVLANLVRVHRKKLSEAKLEGLDNTAKQAFIPLAVCIRIAFLMCRRREPCDHTPKLRDINGDYILTFDKQWLDDHPLTLAGLEQECNHFENIGVKLSFETH